MPLPARTVKFGALYCEPVSTVDVIVIPPEGDDAQLQQHAEDIFTKPRFADLAVPDGVDVIVIPPEGR